MSVRQSKRFVPSGMRKKIKGFSRDAKRNLLWNLQSIDYQSLYELGWTAWFITLTYQDKFYFDTRNDLNIVKDDLDVFFKRLDYFFKKLGRNNKLDWFCFWKMEFTKKGVPHFHLVLFISNSKEVNHKLLVSVIGSFWVKVITRNHKDYDSDIIASMYSASTNVSYVPMNRHSILQVYISKEIGKEYQTNFEGYTGRFWGIVNRKVFNIFKVEDREVVDDWVYYRIRRDLRNYLRSKGYKVRLRNDNGVRGYYLNAEDWRKLLRFYGGNRVA